MLDERQYLLICIQEECSEIQKEVAKCLRFGLYNCNPVTNEQNIEALRRELVDFSTVLTALAMNGVFLSLTFDEIFVLEKAKQAKLSKYKKVSTELGILEEKEEEE